MGKWYTRPVSGREFLNLSAASRCVPVNGGTDGRGDELWQYLVLLSYRKCFHNKPWQTSSQEAEIVTGNVMSSL